MTEASFSILPNDFTQKKQPNNSLYLMAKTKQTEELKSRSIIFHGQYLNKTMTIEG